MEKLCINCENGCILIISNIVIEESFFSADVSLKSDWYEAKTAFESSRDRLVDFSQGLEKMLSENQGKANFINDEGNFDLDIILNEFTGNVDISGTLMKNMVDDASLDYSMKSDYWSVKKLKDNLNNLLSSSMWP